MNRSSTISGDSLDQKDSPRHRLVTIEELGKIAASEPSGYIVENILPSAGLCLVVGKPQAGKTTFLAVIAARIARGKLVGKHVATRGSVVWVSLEHTNSDSFASLNAAMKGAREESLSRIATAPLSGWTLDRQEDIDWLRGELDRLDARIVIIDSLRRASAFDENSSQDARAV